MEAKVFLIKKDPFPTRDESNRVATLFCRRPQIVDGVFPASLSAGGTLSTVALVPWTFNGAQPSRPSAKN